MTERSYRCRACHTVIETAADMDKLEGTATPSWRCRVCKSEVPGIVAERLKHQDG